MTNVIERLNDAQIKIIKHLAVYKFLTTSQLVRLGVASDRTNVHKHIVGLRDRKNPFIMCATAKVIPGAGRLEAVYYLANYGVEAAKSLELQEIKFPVNKQISHTQDYLHRKTVVDCEITIRETGIKIDFFDRYFDTIGNNRVGSNLTSKTKIEFPSGTLNADAIFLLDVTQLETKFLYCLEIHNGKDTKRALEQMHAYIAALEIKAPSRKYGFERGCRVLWVFENEGCMKAVQERAMQDESISRAEKLFLCKLQSDPQNIFFDWQTLKGEKVNMF